MQNDKRVSKQFGMDDSKANAMKRLREARNGGGRLNQAIEVLFNKNLNIFTILFIFIGGNKCRWRD